MLKSKYLIPFLFLLALLAACHYRPMYIPESGEEGDSARTFPKAGRRAILPVSIRGRMR